MKAIVRHGLPIAPPCDGPLRPYGPLGGLVVLHGKARLPFYEGPSRPQSILASNLASL
jgi:hypothetical protein